MRHLTQDQKLFIVEQLAQFKKPQAVADLFHEYFDEEIDRSHVAKYDPTRKFKQSPLGEELTAFFHTKRKKFLEEMEGIPYANPAVRVQKLSDMVDQAEKKKNNKAAAALLEQIAKETGGIYTNKIKVAGGDEGDKPIQHEVSVTDSRIDALRNKARADEK